VHPQGFDVLTYRRGPYPAWPGGHSATSPGSWTDATVQYLLAERRVELLKGFAMREVRRLCDNGHQTAIVTTRTDLAIEMVAYRMFERWTQENFFRYMRQHFALDALVTYAVEPADPSGRCRIPNARPCASSSPTPTPSSRPWNSSMANGRAPITRAASDDARLQDRQRRSEPGHSGPSRAVPSAAGAAREPAERVAVKSLLTRPRSSSSRPRQAPDRHDQDARLSRGDGVGAPPRASLRPHARRGRAVLRELLLASADILPEAERLRIRIHSLANPRSNAALVHLCETLNGLELRYPGTDLKLVYEAPDVA